MGLPPQQSGARDAVEPMRASSGPQRQVWAPNEPDRVVAQGFVLVQGALLVALLASPRRPGWAATPPVRLLSLVMTVSGLAGLAVAAAGLGRGLTPSPLPNNAARLRTDGLYGHVRHPIYSGLLLSALGQVLGAGGGRRTGIFVTLAVWLTAKARWEEARLLKRFPEYAVYAACTPQFIPRVRRPRRCQRCPETASPLSAVCHGRQPWDPMTLESMGFQATGRAENRRPLVAAELRRPGRPNHG